MGSSNICNNLSVCCAHEGKTGTEECKCTSVDSEEIKICPSSCLKQKYFCVVSVFKWEEGDRALQTHDPGRTTQK